MALGACPPTKGAAAMTNKVFKNVNQAYGAGRWFPADPRALRTMLEKDIESASPPAVTGRIIAAIAPHAGYIYSGPVAAHVFRALRDQARAGSAPETVVILGFSHRQAFRGAAIMDGDAITTPLGVTALDRAAAQTLAESRDKQRIFFDSRPHQGEHSAENLIPFVQATLPDAKLLPIIIGDHDPETRNALISALTRLAKDKTITVLASSDMLHDADYDKVTRTDRSTLEKVAAMQTSTVLKTWQPSHQVFCGIAAVAVAMEFAAQQGCKRGMILHYRNSGDDHPESRGQWVVGYGAVAFPIDATQSP
jgi:AmmeMemoRadiSam system protein B